MSPARENARAEGANKIIEAGIQSLLYERNLPPSWWQRAANDVMFLAARLPLYSLEANVPPDQDRAPPIEMLLQGYVSRQQIYRELDSYVSVGTPALCHLPKVKGSDLQSRVRWGIAIGQRGKVTRWMCPFTQSRFKNRSFTAFNLRTGLSWSQFLGLGDIAPSAQSRMLPQDADVMHTIELPEVRAATVELPPAVREIMQTAEAGDGSDNVVRALPAPDGKDLCEYYPRIKRSKVSPQSEPDDDVPEPDDDNHTIIPATGVKVEDHQGESPLITPSQLGGSEDNESDEENLHVEGYEDDPGKLRDILPDTPDDACPSRKKGKPKARKTRKSVRKSSRRTVKGRVGRKKGSKDTSAYDYLDEVQVEVYGLDPTADLQLEGMEARHMRKYTLTTDSRTSWSKICKHMHKLFHQLPHEHHKLYRLWLLTKPSKERGEAVLHVEDLPKTTCDGRGYLQKGLHIPYPSGPHWNRLLGDATYRKQHGNKVSLEEQDEEELYALYTSYMSSLRSRSESIAMVCRAVLGEHDVNRNDFEHVVEQIVCEELVYYDLHACAARKIKRRTTISEEHDPAPRTIIEALMGDRAEDWVESIYKEFNGLTEQGVLSHDWTLKDLHAAGIHTKPVPCSVALTHKYKDGILEKLKTRICIAGHPGNMTKGIHYNDVFAPSPVQHTERILQAMRVHMHLYNLTWDVKMAYTWAPLPAGDRIAIVYPDGFKRQKDGEECYAVLEANLYGHPSAGRGWSQHRDGFILSRFNEKGWSCRRCVHDPCLFVIDRYPESLGESPLGQQPTLGHTGDSLPDPEVDPKDDLPDGVHRSWVLIHTDDCDAYGTSNDVLHEINDIMNDRWTTEIVDSSFVLGVKRTLTEDSDGRWQITMTMTSYIQDMVNAFSSDLKQAFGNRKVKTPFPENTILTKAIEPREGEVSDNIKRGYQRLIGSLMWCVRHVMPSCAYGISQLCKLMACPTDVAWHCALHMLNYLDQHKHEGIRFTEGDCEPVAYVDASNRDDPSDGKTQYGYTIHWGGPLVTKSSKLNHVGINSTYNEYMALHHCVKQVVWLRQLMAEMGLADYLRAPTTVYADNKQANTLCIEDMVTAGNMYFRTGYHYNKEAVRDKYIDVHYVPTEYNISDICTKGLASCKIQALSPYIAGYKSLPTGLY